MLDRKRREERARRGPGYWLLRLLRADPRALLRSDLAALGVLVAGTVWWTGGLWGAALQQKDSSFVLMALAQLQDAILGQGGLRRLAWPMQHAATQADWVLGEAVMALPLRLLGADPATLHSAVSVGGLVLTGLACMVAARALLGRGAHVWVAGLIGAFHPQHMTHLQHLNLLHHELVVLGPLLLGAGLLGRRPGLAGLGALLAALSAQLGVYMGLHAALAAGCVVLAALLAQAGDGRSWLAVGAGGLLGGALFAPIASMYSAAGVSEPTAMEALVQASWDPAYTFVPTLQINLHERIWGTHALAQLPGSLMTDPVNPGFVTLALTALGVLVLLSGRGPGPRWPWAAVAGSLVAAAALALGPTLVWSGQKLALAGPYRLLLQVPGLDGMRDPVRWLMVSLTAAGLLASLATWWLARWSVWLPVVVVGLLAAERATPPTARGQRQGIPLHEDYALVDAIQTPGALWDSLAGARGARPRCGDQSATPYLAALHHGRPLVGGSYARPSRLLDDLNAQAAAWPAPEAVAFLQLINVAVVVDHSPSGADPAAATCQHTAAHRICTLAPTAAPLPAPSALSLDEAGAVSGIRWQGAARLPKQLHYQCGETEGQLDGQLWWLLTRLRYGEEVDFLEVILPTPCAQALRVTPADGVPLYTTDEALWPRR